MVINFTEICQRKGSGRVMFCAENSLPVVEGSERGVSLFQFPILANGHLPDFSYM